mgnify:CR=1 FL=1
MDSATNPNLMELLTANSGVILVTINYRLGAFGFLAHPWLSEESGVGRSGNYAILDQIAALKWVKENIELKNSYSEEMKKSAIFQHIKDKESKDGSPVCGVLEVAISFKYYKTWCSLEEK